MKSIFLLIFLLSVSLSNFGQTVQVSCNLNDTIAPRYKKDADRLAIRRAIKNNTTYKDSLKPYAADRDIYLKAFIAVYNATAIPQRDTVVRMCNIHTLEMPDVNRFVLTADSVLPWMVNVRNNVFPTGNALLDNVMQKYNMQKTSYLAYSFVKWHYAEFRTDTNLNFGPLGVAIIYANQGQVYSASPLCCVFDGPDILDSINPNFTELYYFYRWYDCIDGCDLYKWWKFRVDNNCTVALLGSGGNADLPAGVGIKENKAVLSSVKVYPNPVVDLLTIELTDATEPIDKVSITDVLGQTVWELAHPPAKYEIDTRFLHPGVYFLKAKNETGEKVFKIIKE